jgi:hypothetical protein
MKYLGNEIEITPPDETKSLDDVIVGAARLKESLGWIKNEV